MMGDRKWCGMQGQLKRGYAIASIDYRLSTTAPFPACIINGNKQPPFLIVHGDQDDVVNIEQSYMLRNELEKYGQKVIMHTVFGGGHGFDCLVVEDIANSFLDFHFKEQNNGN